MIVQHRVGLGSLGDMSWEQWCDFTFGANPELNQKCHNKPMGIFTAAPWTVVGAMQRGIPKLNNGEIVDALGQIIGSGAGTAQPPTSPSIFTGVGILGIPKTVLIIGGGVLALGLIASVASRKSRSVAGYRRRRSRRNRR